MVAEQVVAILLCSGRITHDLLKERSKLERDDVAIVSLEQLYPFPNQALTAMLSRFPQAKRITWVQEEPVNMGPWPFVSGKLSENLDRPFLDSLSCVSRAESVSPAVGSKAVHEFEQQELLHAALAR